MKRVWPLALVVCGWVLGSVTGTPQQVYAQARVSLASLQSNIDNIINGTTTVGKATFATTAANATTAQSVPWSGVTGVPASLADGDDNTTYAAGAGLSLTGTTLSLSPDISVDNLSATSVLNVPLSAGGSGVAASTGGLRFNTTTRKLEVSNGEIWVAVH